MRLCGGLGASVAQGLRALRLWQSSRQWRAVPWSCILSLLLLLPAAPVVSAFLPAQVKHPLDVALSRMAPHWKQQRVIGYERARMCLRRFFHCGCEIFSRFEPFCMGFFSELSPMRLFTMARWSMHTQSHQRLPPHARQRLTCRDSGRRVNYERFSMWRRAEFVKVSIAEDAKMRTLFRKLRQ